MSCHGFKGGIGTSSRSVSEADGGCDSRRSRAGELRTSASAAGGQRTVWTSRNREGAVATNRRRRRAAGAGSIIVMVATDAPLLPIQCARLAQRASIGLGRAGGDWDDGSGDIFLGFATGNAGIPRIDSAGRRPATGRSARRHRAPRARSARAASRGRSDSRSRACPRSATATRLAPCSDDADTLNDPTGTRTGTRRSARPESGECTDSVPSSPLVTYMAPGSAATCCGGAPAASVCRARPVRGS